MKKQFIITVAFIAITSFTSQLFAQNSADNQRASWDLAKGKGMRCSVVSTEEGCSFNFTKIEWKNTQGKENGRKQGQSPIIFTVSSIDNSVSQVKSPRDAASGLATGKRMHKPFVITKELDKSSPMLAQGTSSTDAGSDATTQESGLGTGKVSMQDISITSAQSSGLGTGKVSMSDFHFVVKNAGKTTDIVCVDGECDIPTDLPDGDYTMIASWSWGMSQSGSSSTSGSGGKVNAPRRCSVDFLLEIKDGACMAINEKGLPGTKTVKK